MKDPGPVCGFHAVLLFVPMVTAQNIEKH